jgi:hypothetical protein
VKLNQDDIPDVRDGLTRKERVVLWVLGKTQEEWRGRSVPTATLYGRVTEHCDMSIDELQAILQRLGALSLLPR